MRLLAYSIAGKRSYGAIKDGGIVDLGASDQGDLQELIASGNLASLEAKLSARPVDYSLDDISFLPPIERPEKIACIGVNYANRNAEYKDGSKPPEYPSLFMRTPDSLTGHQQDLWRPPESMQLDYEGEIVVVIGRGGRRISEKNAYDHIAGLTIMNEGTLRDWVRHAKFNVTQGKNFVRSGSIGPWIVTADEFSAADYENMRVTTTVNGELRQDDTTANMMFPIAYIISYLSRFFELKPGDIIATGTPNGAGARFDPPRYLVPGDRVEVAVAGVGVLSNSVVDEPLT